VSLVSAHLGRLNRAIEGEYLSLRVKVFNRSQNPITFASWGRPKVPVVLKDREGNYYSIQRASGPDDVTIAPGKSIIDTLLFEPAPAHTELDLDLPIAGTDKAFEFHTRQGFIVRANVPLQELPAVADAEAKGSAAPLDPEKDPVVRKKLIFEYRERNTEINLQARNMSTNNASEHRRRKGRELYESLAKKYKFEVDQVKRILREGTW
jgi:hypothetical protein